MTFKQVKGGLMHSLAARFKEGSKSSSWWKGKEEFMERMGSRRYPGGGGDHYIRRNKNKRRVCGDQAESVTHNWKIMTGE